MSRKEAGNIQAKLGAIQNRRGRRIFVVETLETEVVNGHCFLAQSQLFGQKLCDNSNLVQKNAMICNYVFHYCEF